MTNQYFITASELQGHYQTDADGKKIAGQPPTVKQVFDSIRKELLSEHKILTRIFVNERSFEHEDFVEAGNLDSVQKLGYEFISVAQIIQDMVKEWDQVIEDILKRGNHVKKLETSLSPEWMAKENLHIQETFADLVESFESIKEYFGDSLIAPFIQVDCVEERMALLLKQFNQALDEKDTKTWYRLFHTEFVQVLEIWQTFFYGVQRIFA